MDLSHLACVALGMALVLPLWWWAARRARPDAAPALDEDDEAELRDLRGDLSAAHQAIARQELMSQRMALVARATSNPVIITDRDGRIEWINDGFVRLTGFKAEEALGRTPGVLLQGADTDPATVATMREGVMTGTGFHVQVLNYTRYRKPYWIDIEAMPVRDEDGRISSFVGIGTDVTGMKQVQAELERSADLLRETQSAAHIGGWLFDCRTRTPFWTEETYRIHGVDPAVYRPDGVRDLDFYLPESRARVVAAVDVSMRDGTPWNLELQLVTGTGEARWVRSIGHVRRTGEVTTHLYGSFQDITGERAIRDQLAEAAARAQAADHAKSAFLAMMSHEIRTPMNGVIGMAGLLGMTTLNEEQRLYLSTIVTSGELLLTIIDDVLDFSKIEAGQLAIAPVPVDLHALLATIERLLRPTAAGKRLELAVELGAAVPQWVEVDGGRLRQILINLVGNALKFTRQGGVRIAVDAVAAGDHRVELVLAVHDSGIGIPPEVQQRLFQPFVQAEGAATTRRFGGTGLGLAICKRLAELMGGSIALRSEPGVGSTFTVRLTVAIVRSDESRVRHAIHLGAAAPAVAPGRRALVVEDNQVSQLLATMLLKSMGYAVATADDGRAAVPLVQATRYDVILMDTQMPHLDGYAVTRLIRGQPGPNRDTRIIAITANVLPEDEAACRAAGMDEFVPKPIRVERLHEALNAAQRPRGEG